MSEGSQGDPKDFCKASCETPRAPFLVVPAYALTASALTMHALSHIFMGPSRPLCEIGSYLVLPDRVRSICPTRSTRTDKKLTSRISNAITTIFRAVTNSSFLISPFLIYLIICLINIYILCVETIR